MRKPTKQEIDIAASAGSGILNALLVVLLAAYVTYAAAKSLPDPMPFEIGMTSTTGIY